MKYVTPLFAAMVAKTILRFSTFFLLPVLLLVSCKKGDTGPAGEKGPAGATGDAGPKGTANVIYSAWAYSTTFRDSLIDNSNMKVANVAAPQIVDSILARGTVLVYLSFSQGTYILPYTNYAGNKLNTISYLPMPGKVLITRFTHDNSGSIGLPATLTYRYIIIPGGIAGRQAAVNYSEMTYQQVCDYLHIPL